MTSVDVLCDVLCDDVLVFIQGVEKVCPHLCGDFVRNVKKLAQVIVIILTGLVMSQRGGKSLPAPFINLLRIRQFRSFDIDNGFVRPAKLVHPR